MTTMQTPFIPPSKGGSIVASSPLHPPLHPPSHVYPHTPKGCALALGGDARPSGSAPQSLAAVSLCGSTEATRFVVMEVLHGTK